MKKYLLSLAVMAMGAGLLTGCQTDNSDNPGNPDNDMQSETFVTKGVFVVNNGSSYQAIDGSLTYFDYTTGEANTDIYKTVNGKSLGGTPNDVIVYGQKVYVVGSDENTIFVMDVRNCKELKLAVQKAILPAVSLLMAIMYISLPTAVMWQPSTR